MKVAVFSDVHGNILALEKSLAWMDRLGAEYKIFLGDIFGYYPFGAQCLETLVGSGVHCLLGNHDAMVLGQGNLPPEKECIVQLERDKTALTSGERSQLESHCSVAFREWAGCSAWFFHGTPWDPVNGRLYPDASIPSRIGLECEFIFMGHTHRPFIRNVNGVSWVNVGSCGLPRDEGGWPSFAILDTTIETVEIFRFQLDAQDFWQEMRGKAHQDVLDCLLRNEPSIGTKLKD